MSRELKFRAWDAALQKMWQWDKVRREHLDALEDPTWVFMQFTGIKDKTSAEIYEGDILPGRYFIQNLAVIWDEALASFELSGNACSEHLIDVSGPNDLGYNPWEVIGNIYENPELLESK